MTIFDHTYVDIPIKWQFQYILTFLLNYFIDFIIIVILISLVFYYFCWSSTNTLYSFVYFLPFSFLEYNIYWKMYASLLKISPFFTYNLKNESCKNKASWWGEIKWKNNDRKTTCVGNSKRSSSVRSSCFSRTYDYIDFVHIFLWQVALQLNLFYKLIVLHLISFFT